MTVWNVFICIYKGNWIGQQVWQSSALSTEYKYTHTHSHNQTAVNKDLDINESKEKKRTHMIKMSVRLNQVNEY